MPNPKCVTNRGSRTWTTPALGTLAIQSPTILAAVRPTVEHRSVVLFRIDIPERPLISDLEIAGTRRVRSNNRLRARHWIRRAELSEQRSIDEQWMPMTSA